jgi:putative DNA primase/helicase
VSEDKNEGQRDQEAREGKIVSLPQGREGRKEKGPLPVFKFELTEYGNAQRMVNYFGEELLFVEAWRTWLHWDGTHWERLTKAGIMRFAQATVDKIFEEAARNPDPLEAELLIGWAYKSRATSKLRAMIAQAEFLLEATPEEFDREEDTLPCANGVINLRTGAFRESSHEDRISLWTPVVYDREATCPTFEKFFREVMDENEEMMAYMHRLIGYFATNSTAEQIMPFFYGQGSNGKGVLLRTLQNVLGPFAWQVNWDFLQKKGYIGHPTDIAQLQGKRVVVVPELAKGDYLNEARFKWLIGGDVLGGRFIAKDFTNWRPTHKLVMATNHLPKIKSQDDGTWRRIRVITFKRQWAIHGAEHVIPGVPVADPSLETKKLPREYSGILKWIVQGAVEYFQKGLGQPEQVTRDTQAYQTREDRIGVYLKTRAQPKTDAETRSRLVYEDYATWCKDQGEEPLDDKAFMAEVRRKGYRHKHKNDGNVVVGVVLVPR